jgi:hypothetical protein
VLLFVEHLWHGSREAGEKCVDAGGAGQHLSQQHMLAEEKGLGIGSGMRSRVPRLSRLRPRG